ncbi:MAG: hypothetical protein ACP5D2_03920 [Candidatus Nanoarchaeia archaeon]
MANRLATWILSTALVLGSAGCSEEHKQEPLEEQTKTTQTAVKTEANQYLENFPENIPGAGNIKKNETEGAERCLVHIKQMHDNPASHHIPTKDEILSREYKIRQDNKIIPPEYGVLLIQNIYQGVNDSQKGIYQILETITQQGQEVLMEGVFDRDNIDKMNAEFSDFYLRELKRLKRTGYFNTREEYEYIPGAIIKLAAEGRLRAVPAEKSQFCHNRYNIEGREDALLELISQSGNPYSISVYGSGHNFYDNIQEWNEKHPDNKISLIEVTPESHIK